MKQRTAVKSYALRSTTARPSSYSAHGNSVLDTSEIAQPVVSWFASQGCQGLRVTPDMPADISDRLDA